MATATTTTVQDFNTLDPFTQVYRQLRRIIMADSVLSPILNVLKFPDLTDTSFFQLMNKPSLMTSDTPAVYLVQGKWSIVPRGPDSRIGQFIQTFPLIIVQDNQQLIPVNKFKWRLMVALGINGPSLGLSPLVEKNWLEDGVDDLFGNQDFKQFQERWMSVGSIKVQGFIDQRLYAQA